MKKFLVLVAIGAMALVIIWCNGCSKPKAAQVAATAPPAVHPPCPDGSIFEEWIPANDRPYPGPIHGPSGSTTVFIRFPHGTLVCATS
jgi:hypothetical protein